MHFAAGGQPEAEVGALAGVEVRPEAGVVVLSRNMSCSRRGAGAVAEAEPWRKFQEKEEERIQGETWAAELQEQGEKTKKENEFTRSLEELEEDQPKKYVEAV